MVQVYLECLMGLNVWVAGSYLLILDGCFQKKNHHFLHLWWKFLCVLNFIPPTQIDKGRWAGRAPLWLNAKGSGPTSLGRSIHSICGKGPQVQVQMQGLDSSSIPYKIQHLGQVVWPSCASVSPSMQWDQDRAYLIGLLYSLNELIFFKYSNSGSHSVKAI